MDGHNTQTTRTRFAAMVIGLLTGSGAAFAAPLNPGSTLSPVPGEPDPASFSAVTAPLIGPFSNGGISGAVRSQVYFDDTSNPFGGLTFAYIVDNNSTSSAALAHLAIDAFGGYSIDANYQSPAGSGNIPAMAQRNAALAGSNVGFTFASAVGAGGPLMPGQSSSMLVLQTNATDFVAARAAQIDGSGVLVYVPAIPEPASLSLVGAGLLLLARRRRA